VKIPITKPLFDERVVITLDVDWAPDFVIDAVAQLLVERRVRATWFVTHRSAAVERLSGYGDLFELGIHPNFLARSTHGETPDAVLRHCLELVPGATSMRTHSLVQSTPLLAQVLRDTPITTDVSLFMPRTPFLRPHEFWWRGRALVRIPFFWEDDCEMQRGDPCWRLAQLLRVGEGLKVFDFHPLHVYLNSARPDEYALLKSRVGKLSETTPADVADIQHEGEGTKTLFLETVEHLASAGTSLRIRDVSERWRNGDAA